MLASEFDYELPPDRIAQVPAEPRDSARLLDTRDMSDHAFSDLPQLLEPGDLVVVNRTRVRAARLRGRRTDTGGEVEALLLAPTPSGYWRAALRPARRLRSGLELAFGPIAGRIVEGPQEGVALLELTAPEEIETAIARVGEVPLPPYIKVELADPERYQTIFAQTIGSAAASTAALHFTPGVVGDLEKAGISLAEVELHIGLDTFRPITTATIEGHHIHTEEFSIPSRTENLLSHRRGRVVAVGTTVVRALESDQARSSTSLFITPGHRFRRVDLLITNFHLPRTTLLVLLAAFMGDRWKVVYDVALSRGYRFASFGDAMLAELKR